MSDTPPPVFRFAPSPNGYLHLGHAFSALLNFRMARASGGRFLLRIEDIDSARSKPDYERAIYEDLGWLGLTWEEPVWRQREHLDNYQSALERLKALSLLYPCTCSRTDIAKAVGGKTDWPQDPDHSPLYPGTCKGRYGKPPEEPHAWRLDMAKALQLVKEPLSWQEQKPGSEETKLVAAHPELWGDAVLARKDIGTSYHIAVVTDDAAQGASDIVRGADLYEATSLHRLLQTLLGLPQPLYHHHDLILDEARQKLSKSAQSKSLRALREEGISPEQIIAALPLPF